MTALRDALIACGAVRFGDFTLASGAKSKYYVDIKRASTDPHVLRLIGESLGAAAAGAQRIAGMELGAIPLAAAAALSSNIPFLMVRKKAKDHGTTSRIEGPYRSGEEVVVVEDVTTSGGSSLEAVKVLRDAGLVVKRVVTVVDREAGAAQAFADLGVTLSALVRASDLLAVHETPKILLVGGGAREHAMADAIVRAGATLYACLPNKNPGIVALAREHFLVKDTDAAAIAAKAKEWGTELAVVGPDAALAAGVTDALKAVGVAVASPTKGAAQIEWDKAFMRDLLERHDVPGRVKYRTFDSMSGMREYVDALGAVAVKPIGLTGGKGVKVTGDHLHSTADALRYAEEIFATGQGGGRVIVEEKVEGEEFSLMAFCDGTDCVPLPPVQDHKRAFEGDKGPNTGGMGSYSGENSLLPFLTSTEYEASLAILRAILQALAKEDRAFVGVVYGQFMLTSTGPRVIEINARFGDPEAMNVLTLLESNYVEVLQGMASGRLDPKTVRASNAASVCKYVVPEGYGTKSMADQPVEVDEGAIRRAGAHVYYAAVNHVGGVVGEVVHATTTTSRAVGVVATGATLAEANAKVDAALAHVKGPHLFHRKDIGTAELIAKRVTHMVNVRGH